MPATSASSNPAEITTAASTEIGSVLSSHGVATSMDPRTTAATTPGQLRLGARRLVDGGPGLAAADGEALEEPHRQVRNAERDELLVGVHLVAEATGERLRQHARVGQRDHGDTERRGHEPKSLRDPDPGPARQGQSLRQHADGGDAVGLQLE